MSIGAAAIESAKEARRAADLALKASEAAERASAITHSAHTNGDERLDRFSRRADRLGARFRALQRR